MGFVKMKNLKGEIVRIPRSAVKAYQNLGFYSEEQNDAIAYMSEELEDAIEDTTEELEDVSAEQETEATTEDVNEDEAFVNTISKKPLASWNKDEVKRYASILGIDLSGTKSANDAKERIKAFMKDAE